MAPLTIHWWVLIRATVADWRDWPPRDPALMRSLSPHSDQLIGSRDLLRPVVPKSDYDYRGLDRLAGVFVPLEFPPGEWRGASDEEFDPVSSLGSLAEVTVVSAVDGGRGEGDTH